MNALVTIDTPCLPVAFQAELELASDFAKASKSKSTIAAYGNDFRIFEAWCRGRGLTALPATREAVVAFLAAQATAGKRASTLQRRLAAIGYVHKIATCRARLVLRISRPR
jgi:site-specific recombinase XerD